MASFRRREIGDLQVSIVLAVKGGYRDEYLFAPAFLHQRARGLRIRRGLCQFPRGCGRRAGRKRAFPQQQPAQQRPGPRGVRQRLVGGKRRANRHESVGFPRTDRGVCRARKASTPRNTWRFTTPGKSSPCKWAWISPPMISRPGWAAGCNSCPPRKAPISCIAAKARIARALFALL